VKEVKEARKEDLEKKANVVMLDLLEKKGAKAKGGAMEKKAKRGAKVNEVNEDIPVKKGAPEKKDLVGKKAALGKKDHPGKKEMME
jgi:hypothetical protein